MNPAGGWRSRSAMWKPIQGQLAVQVARERPSDTAARIGIQQGCQVDEVLWQMDGGQISHPELIEPTDLELTDQIGIDMQAMLRVGRVDHPTLALGLHESQRVHQAQHPFVVDLLAHAFEGGGHAPIARA